MTREDAIIYLKEMKDECNDTFHKVRYVTKEKVLEMAIQALSQEPNRDMEEIAEIMESDAEAETKCKMISNILTAKPHYFELSQEPCTDAVSREDAIGCLTFNGHYDTLNEVYERLKKLPPVTQKSGKWIKQTLSVKPFGEDTVLCDQCAFMTDIDSMYNYCPNCGAYMREPQESEDKE